MIGVSMRVTPNRKRWNASSLRVIRLRRLAYEIVRFCFYSHDLDFGRAILSSFVWAISTGKEPGFTSLEKGVARHDWR